MTTTITWQRHGVFCTYGNTLYTAEIRRVITELNSDPRMQEAQFVIHDLTATQAIEEGVAVMLAIAGHLYGLVPYNRSAKTAVLIANAAEAARFNGLSTHSVRPLHAFNNMQSAHAWIGADLLD